MCSQGGAPLPHFPRAFIEHFLIPVTNAYVAFLQPANPIRSRELIQTHDPTSSVLLIHFGEEL